MTMNEETGNGRELDESSLSRLKIQVGQKSSKKIPLVTDGRSLTRSVTQTGSARATGRHGRATTRTAVSVTPHSLVFGTKHEVVGEEGRSAPHWSKNRDGTKDEIAKRVGMSNVKPPAGSITNALEFRKGRIATGHELYAWEARNRPYWIYGMMRPGGYAAALRDLGRGGRGGEPITKSNRMYVTGFHRISLH